MQLDCKMVFAVVAIVVQVFQISSLIDIKACFTPYTFLLHFGVQKLSSEVGQKKF